MNAEYDHLFKLLLIGDSGVGKTSILLQFTTEEFTDREKPTIGVDLKVKLLDQDNKRVKLTIWDTAGQERYKTLTSAYYRGAHGIALVYDVCDRASFENIQEWLREVDLYCTNEDCVKLLIGNKIDRAERVVTKAEATAYARANNMLSLETSAKSAAGVHEAFTELVQKILDQPSMQAQPVLPASGSGVGGGGSGGKKKSAASSAVKLDQRAPAQSYCFGACYSNA